MRKYEKLKMLGKQKIKDINVSGKTLKLANEIKKLPKEKQKELAEKTSLMAKSIKSNPEFMKLANELKDKAEKENWSVKKFNMKIANLTQEFIRGKYD